MEKLLLSLSKGVGAASAPSVHGSLFHAKGHACFGALVRALSRVAGEVE